MFWEGSECPQSSPSSCCAALLALSSGTKFVFDCCYLGLTTHQRANLACFVWCCYLHCQRFLCAFEHTVAPEALLLPLWQSTLAGLRCCSSFVVVLVAWRWHHFAWLTKRLKKSPSCCPCRFSQQETGRFTSHWLLSSCWYHRGSGSACRLSLFRSRISYFASIDGSRAARGLFVLFVSPWYLCCQSYSADLSRSLWVEDLWGPVSIG